MATATTAMKAMDARLCAAVKCVLASVSTLLFRFRRCGSMFGYHRCKSAAAAQ
jgi:hypothetical protein